MSCFLQLHDTDLSTIDGEIPTIIELRQTKLILGRGSPLFPVDVKICAKKNDKDIISRNHANIVFTDNTYILNDMGAMNGLFVNDVRVRSHVLKHNDIIQFGGLFNMPTGSILSKSDLNVKYKFIQTAPIQVGKKRATPAESLLIAQTPSKAAKTSNNLSASASKTVTIKVPPKICEKVTVTKIDIASAGKVDKARQQGKVSNQANSLQNGSFAGDSPRQHQLSAKKGTPVSSGPGAASQSTPTCCSIDLSSLRGSLTCTLCSNLLVDAVVLRCSHGFCRACVETHIRQYRSTCPVCNDAPANRSLATQGKRKGE